MAEAGADAALVARTAVELDEVAAALTLWAAVHGLVHLELQGYFAAEPSTQIRLADIVIGLIRRPGARLCRQTSRHTRLEPTQTVSERRFDTLF
jgi:Tetracyclin repressor-like, C-terminal domain